MVCRRPICGKLIVFPQPLPYLFSFSWSLHLNQRPQQSWQPPTLTAHAFIFLGNNYLSSLSSCWWHWNSICFTLSASLNNERHSSLAHFIDSCDVSLYLNFKFLASFLFLGPGLLTVSLFTLLVYLRLLSNNSTLAVSSFRRPVSKSFHCSLGCLRALQSTHTPWSNALLDPQ